jgi:hypothetical protein
MKIGLLSGTSQLLAYPGYQVCQGLIKPTIGDNQLTINKIFLEGDNLDDD